MKHSIVFLLILCSSLFFKVFGCGPYYPLGDDIRFTLLKPGVFNYPDFVEFNYSSGLFYSLNYSKEALEIKSSDNGSEDPNVLLWRERCKNVPSVLDVYNAVYVLGNEINDPNNTNTFIRYLHQHKDVEAISYLSFAKKCSPFNTIIEDPWERQETAKLPQRKKLINEALNKSQMSKDEQIKLRYAFLAIRLAYYNDDSKSIEAFYDSYFANKKNKNIIGYWGLYFRTLTETDSVKRNYNAAQVFAFAPDKRMNIFYRYNKEIPIDKTLEYAKTNDEKLAVWLMAGFRKTGKTLDVLKTIYTLKPNESGLSFLLLREINKLEDWIYTPYYTYFNPSLEPWEYQAKTYPLSRIQGDRKYANELLSFVQAADLKRVENPKLWQFAQAYLYYMTEDYTSSLKKIKLIQNKNSQDAKLNRQLVALKALCLTARQKENAIIPEEIKPMLIQEFAAKNYKLIFAIARELEFKGNTTDAAALLSKLKRRANQDEDDAYWTNGIYWKAKIKNQTLNVDYYDDYFFYLDAQYNPDQLETLIADVKVHHAKDQFSCWEYEVLEKDIDRLYDMLGTKQLRRNNLKEALSGFEKVADTLWTSKYYPYRTYLDANPFYTNMFNEHKKTVGDTIRFTKVSITRTLIEYLKKAEDVKNKDRDCDYFLAANCYLNMTQYGNSWIMKRYFWTINSLDSKFEDNDDYYNCSLAKQYYLKAKEASRNERFAALCLRMAGRCENYRIRHLTDENKPNVSTVENSYYADLMKQYPSFYKDLTSNCESFERYFKSR